MGICSLLFYPLVPSCDGGRTVPSAPRHCLAAESTESKGWLAKDSSAAGRFLYSSALPAESGNLALEECCGRSKRPGNKPKTELHHITAQDNVTDFRHLQGFLRHFMPKMLSKGALSGREVGETAKMQGPQIRAARPASASATSAVSFLQAKLWERSGHAPCLQAALPLRMLF